jgi:hypothetical protein
MLNESLIAGESGRPLLGFLPLDEGIGSALRSPQVGGKTTAGSIEAGPGA